MNNATVTRNRQTGAMTDITVTSGQLTSSTWVFGNAQADPNTGKVNMYNKAMARAAQLALWNDEQIVRQNKDVRTSTDKLSAYNKARTDWKTTDWSTLSGADKKARSDLLKSIGIAQLNDSAEVTIVGTTTKAYGPYPPVNLASNYSATADTALVPGFGGINLDPGVIYRSADGKAFVHTGPGTNVLVNEPQLGVDTFQRGGPTASELASYKAAFQKASDTLSTFSATEQARLQQFVTQKSVLENLLSTLIQVAMRMKSDIVARFG